MDWTSPSQCSNSTQNLRKRSRWTKPRRFQDREAPGFENQRRCPRRCAADAQIRTVRHPTQNSKLQSALAEEFLDELKNVSHRAAAIEIWLVEAVMSGAGYRASSQSRQR